MRILGLDLSLTSTGYCLIDDPQSPLTAPTGWHLTWYGSVGSKTLRDVDRLAMFNVWIRNALQTTVWGLKPAIPIDAVAIEGYSFGSAVGLAQQGELGGVIKLAIYEYASSVFHRGMAMHVIPPSTWKKQLLGKGNLPKDMVRIEAFKRYGVEFASQDALDAWAVAMCLRRQLLGLDKPEPIKKRKAVASDVVQPSTMAS